MEKIKLSPKSFKWLLCCGLVLLVVPMVIELLCFNSGFHFFGYNGLFFGNSGLQSNTSIATHMRWNGMGFMLLTMLLIIPIVEELAFRFWAVGKKMAFFVVSLVIVTAYMLFVCGWVWAVVSTVALCLVYLCTNKKPCTRAVAMLVITSALFSVAYCLGCEAPVVVVILDIIKTFGFGLVVGCLVLQLRFGFLWAVLVHVVFNAINIVPMLCQQTYETDDCTITTKAMLDLDENNPYMPIEESAGSFTIRGDMQEITAFSAIELARPQSQGSYEELVAQLMSQTTFYQTHFYQSTPVEVTITDKKGGKSSTELNKHLMDYMLDNGIIASDTFMEPMQYLAISNPELFANKYDSTLPACSQYACSIESLIALLRFTYKLPLQPAPDVNYLAPCRIENKLFTKISLDEAMELLEQYGITIKEDPHSRAQIIKFKYFW